MRHSPSHSKVAQMTPQWANYHSQHEENLKNIKKTLEKLVYETQCFPMGFNVF